MIEPIPFNVYGTTFEPDYTSSSGPIPYVQRDPAGNPVAVWYPGETVPRAPTAANVGAAAAIAANSLNTVNGANALQTNRLTSIVLLGILALLLIKA